MNSSSEESLVEVATLLESLSLVFGSGDDDDDNWGDDWDDDEDNNKVLRCGNNRFFSVVVPKAAIGATDEDRWHIAATFLEERANTSNTIIEETQSVADNMKVVFLHSPHTSNECRALSSTVECTSMLPTNKDCEINHPSPQSKSPLHNEYSVYYIKSEKLQGSCSLCMKPSRDRQTGQVSHSPGRHY